jgi:hypothetical protein
VTQYTVLIPGITNNFITTLLGIFPHEIGEKYFHIGTGADIRPKKTVRKSLHASMLTPFSELLPNLYYSPIKIFENILIFKIARQQRP